MFATSMMSLATIKREKLKRRKKLDVGHLEPPEEEGKLDGEEERVEQVQLCLGIAHREAVRLLRKRVC